MEKTEHTVKSKIVFTTQGLGESVDFFSKTCISCHIKKTSELDMKTAPQFKFVDTSERFNYRVITEAKGRIQTSSNGKS